MQYNNIVHYVCVYSCTLRLCAYCNVFAVYDLSFDNQQQIYTAIIAWRASKIIGILRS